MVMTRERTAMIIAHVERGDTRAAIEEILRSLEEIGDQPAMNDVFRVGISALTDGITNLKTDVTNLEDRVGRLEEDA